MEHAVPAILRWHVFASYSLTSVRQVDEELIHKMEVHLPRKEVFDFLMTRSIQLELDFHHMFLNLGG